MAARTAVRLAASATAEAAVECVAVDISPTGHVHLYAGTTTGALLVYDLPVLPSDAPGDAPPQLRLLAKRSLGRRPIEALCLFPAARTLAALCDGTVTLVSTDTLEGVAFAAARGATHLCKDVRPGTGRSRLAVALKRRVLLCELAPAGPGAQPGEAPQQPRVLAEVEWPGSPLTLAWYWDGLLAGTRRGYFSVSLRSAASGGAPTEVCPLPPDATTPPALAALPPSGEAVLLADAVGIVVSMAGVPRGNPVAFGTPPVGMAHTPPYVLSLSHDRRTLDVWDRSGGARVQQLSMPFTPGGPATGGSLGPASLLIPRPEGAPQQQAACADDGAGGVIAVGAGRTLCVVLPVPLEAQVKELFRTKQHDACLSLVAAWQAANTPPDGAMLPPPAWMDALHAELGFLRLTQGQWGGAVEQWMQCASFQPHELFPLFPDLTVPFRANGAPLKRYWSLHPPLTDLGSVVRGTLRARGMADASAAAVEAASKEATVELTRLLEHLCARGGSIQQSQDATPGADCGPDTLLLLLYAQQGNMSAAEGLAGSAKRHVLVPHAVPFLEQWGCHLAVVTLHARHGAEAAAVEVCAQLLAGQRTEAARQAADVKHAAASAAAMVLGRSTDTALVLRSLPWLLDAAPEQAQQVLTAAAKSLPKREVLALIRPRSGEPLLTYLEAVVLAEPQAPEEALHSELGTALIAAVAAARSQQEAAPPRDDTDSPPRRRLRAFLGRSARYDALALLSQLEACGPPPLLRERVLLHAAQGAHLQALTILVTQLQDCDAAESYAAGRDSHEGRCEAHAALLHLYLRPQPGSPPTEVLYSRAARVLSSQGGSVDGATVLDGLPDEAPIALLLQPLAGLLISASHRRRTAAVQAGLARRQRQLAGEALADERALGVMVSDDSCCGVCQSRLGPPGEFRPFARFPGGLLACYRCAVGFKQGRPKDGSQ